MMQPNDADARRRALDPTRSFICEAPAGSGKTELLSQRILTLLARVQTPEAVLAITFTRKAAAEMRERVLQALEMGRGEAPVDGHRQHTWQLARAALARDAEAGWQLLKTPSRLQIKTFDSLARQLMQSLPLHTGLDASWPPVEDAEPLYREAARDLLDSLEQDVPWAESLALLFEHLDNRYGLFERLLVMMLASRDAWMNVLSVAPHGDLRTPLEGFWAIALGDKVAEMHTLLAGVDVTELLSVARHAGLTLERQTPEAPLAGLADLATEALPGAAASDIAHWRLLSQLLLTGTGTWRKRVDKNMGFPAPGKGEGKAEREMQKKRMEALLAQLAQTPGLLDALVEVRHWPQERYSDEQWPILKALTEILPLAVVHLRWVFQRHQLLDFTEISQQARVALGDEDNPTDLVQRLDYRIAHILVDEFQDTSFTQVEMLKKLTWGWQPDDGRTLFCVGDAMQSIYGFRGANVGLFLHCREHGLGPIPLEALRLSVNFRSQGAIVAWVNQVFAKAFPQRLDIAAGAVPFGPADAFRPAVKPAVTTHIFDPEQADAATGWLLAELQRLRATQPHWRIGILVKARDHAKAITAALQAAGVRYRAQELVPLAEREAVRDVLNLTHALLDPGDRISWLAVLRAPWCGLLLADLLALTQVQPTAATVLEQVRLALSPGASVDPGATQDLFAQPPGRLTGDGQARLQAVFAVLDAAVSNRDRKPLAVWVAGVWRALGGPQLLEAPEDFANLERYWQLLEALSAERPRPARADLERGIARLFAAPDPGADESLQIMTIHKSKGLEFDAVFLPDLHRQGRASDRDLLLWHERLSHAGEETLLLAPIHAKGSQRDPQYQHLLFEKEKRETLERCRLLYVACTRARERLYLVGSLKREEQADSQWIAPAAGSLLGIVWPAVELTAETMLLQPLEPAPEPSRLPPCLKRVAAVGQTPARPVEHLLQAFVPPYDFTNQALPEPVSTAMELPRLVGTLIHEMAFRIVRNGADILQESRWRAHWHTRLQAAELPEAELGRALDRIERVLAQMVSSKHFAWLIQQSEKHLEWPLAMVDGETVRRLVVDALVVDDEGVAWVIDYKTSQPLPDETEADFIRRESATYRTIMANYRAAVVALGYHQVRTVLYFLEPDLWLEI